MSMPNPSFFDGTHNETAEERDFRRIVDEVATKAGILKEGAADFGTQRHQIDALQAHSLQVAKLSKILATALGGFSPEMRQQIFLGALFHDIGKASDRALHYAVNLNRTLTDPERKIMQTHPERGANILEERGRNSEANIAKYHHAFYNTVEGKITGYKHFSLENLSKSVRRQIEIVSAADAACAMIDWFTEIRGYGNHTPATPNTSKSEKNSAVIRQVMTELQNGSGTQFSPEIVAAFSLTQIQAQLHTHIAQNLHPQAIHSHRHGKVAATQQVSYPPFRPNWRPDAELA